MLGAVSLRPWEQSLFKLVLTMHSSQDEVPPSLAEHFDLVLNQAKVLIGDPSRVSDQISREALELALELQGSDTLVKEISNIPGLRDLSPETATKILSEMEIDPCLLRTTCI